MLSEAALFVYNIVLGTLFVLGFAGNLLVLLVICSLNTANAVTNIYLINLAIADSLHLLSIPPFIHLSVVKSWLWGTVGCKFYYLLHYANSNVSIYIITAMSFDRFKAVVSPFSSARYRTKRFAVIVLTCLWLLSALLVSPIYINAYVESWTWPPVNRTGENELVATEPADAVIISYTCMHLPPGSVNQSNGLLSKLLKDPYYFSRYIFVTGCVVPGLLLCSFYFLILRKLWLMKRSRSVGAQAQQRFEKVTVLVVAVITFYLACCLPHWIFVNVALELHDQLPAWIPAASHLTTLLGYVNSAGNPVLYAFLNEPFRASLRAILARRLPAGWFNVDGDVGAAGAAAAARRCPVVGAGVGEVGGRGGALATDADGDPDVGSPLKPHCTRRYEPLLLRTPGSAGGGESFNASSSLMDETTAGFETRVTETVID